LNIIQTIIKKCYGEKIILDEKMKENRWRYRKYTIILGDDLTFTGKESVKVIGKTDFEEIKLVIKGLKTDKKHLDLELKDIKMENNEQKAFVNYLKGISFD
jgi:hypothetical protein